MYGWEDFLNKMRQQFRGEERKIFGGWGGLAREIVVLRWTQDLYPVVLFSCDDHHSTNEAAILRAENWLLCFGWCFLVYRSLSCIKCLATFSKYGWVATK